MSFPFDATMKELGGAFPADFLSAFDAPPSQPIALLNVDLSTVTASADLVIGIGTPLAEVIHIDFQSSAMGKKHFDIIAYNVLLHREYEVPVHSIVILLRPSAAHSNMNGEVRYAARPGRGKMEFGYELVPLWECPVEQLLASGLGVLPLAVLGQLPDGVELIPGLTSVVQRIQARLEAGTDKGRAEHLLTTAYVLTGLRVNRTRTKQIFSGIKAMQESDSYLGLLDEGREQQVKDDILRLGKKKFGEPTAPARTTLEGIADLDRLKRIHDRLLEAPTWDDLIDTQ